VLDYRFPLAIYLVRCEAGHAAFARPGEDEDHCPCGLPWTVIFSAVAHQFASGDLIGLPSIAPPQAIEPDEDDDE
jgi:hypothetical protein